MEKDPYKELINSNYTQEFPSKDFTNVVMQKIELAAEHKSPIQPLISAKAWWIIGTLYSLLFLTPLVMGFQEGSLLMVEQLNFINIDFSGIKESLQLILTLVFVFASLTLSDILLRKKEPILT